MDQRARDLRAAVARDLNRRCWDRVLAACDATGARLRSGARYPDSVVDDGPCADALVALYYGLDQEAATETPATVDLRGQGRMLL